jgi:hypothetical protein
VKIKIDVHKSDWWFWAVISAFILVALLGWEPGYYLVMLISAFQVIYFYTRHKSLVAFDTQVRIVYFVFTLVGLIDALRFPFYALLFPATMMAVLFDRCGIALALKHMPWNKQPLTKIQ